MRTKHTIRKVVFIVLCAVFLINPFIINAQPSRGFNYQAIARDKAGQPIVNKDIVIEVSIRSGGTLGPIVWQEGHEVITNQFGLFTIIIGQGITTGIGTLSSFNDIPWSITDYFVRIRVDFGNGLIDMGVSKLQAVPFAMLADSVLHSSSYAVGTGLTLSANTISHAPHSGDATGIVNLSVVGLQGRPLVGNAPLLNDVIKWNGSAWAPTVDDNTIYTAGTGISISGTTISQLSHSGDATGSSTLTVTGIQGRTVSATAPNNGEILKWNGTDWTPATDDNASYSAGAGIVLTGTIISQESHTGDATGITTLTVTGLQGRLLSATAPLNGDVIKWNGTDWAPDFDASNEYAAGPGLSLNLNTFFTLPHTHTGDVFGQTSLTVQGLQGRAVSANSPLNAEVLKWNSANMQWEPASDNGNAYSAGPGIILSSNTISADNSSTIWNASKLMGNDISATAPNSGEVLAWNGSAWIPTVSSSTGYAAGTGITLTGNTFSVNNTIAIWNANQLNGSSVSTIAPSGGEMLGWNGTEWIPTVPSSNPYTAGNGITLTGNTFSHTDHSGDATGATNLTVVGLQGRTVSTVAPSGGEVLGWDGTTWIPTVPSSNPYTAGSGITLTGNSFSHSNHSGDATGSTMLTVVGIQGRTVSTVAPSGGEVLGWDGTKWIPTVPSSNPYVAGTGITLTGASFIHTAHSGDATGSTTLTVVGLQGRTVSTIAPSGGEVLGWNGTTWVPTVPSSNPYVAGTGITLTGASFIHTAHSGDATGATTLTVVGLQGRTVSTIAPSGGEVLGWNGAAWTPTVPSSNPYTAGNGITLTGNTFSNSGDLSSVNELQNLAYAAATRILTISSGFGVILPLFNTITTVSGLVPGSNSGGPNVFLNGSGTWTAPPGSAYSAGAGITLTGTVFSQTAHSGDATGATTLTVRGLQGRAISTIAPSGGEFLGWNGASWIPTVPSSNPYTAGSGITLTGNSFSHTLHSGDVTGATTLTVVGLQGRTISTIAPSGGEVLGWNGVSWIPTVPSSNPYTAGAGITLTGNSFSHTLHSGDATGATTLTVVGLQGRTVSAAAPGNGNVLTWNGASWIPAVSSSNPYAAGTGLSLNANTFFNTGDLSSVNEIQSLSYDNATRTVNISLGGSGTALPLFSSAIAGLTPVSPGGTATFLRADGTWIAPPGANYDAGAGITLTTNTFSHTAHSGDATGATTLTVVGLQGRGIATTTPSIGSTLVWDGTSWTPVAAGNVSGSGTPTQVAFWNGPNSLTSDANLYWDNTNKRLGIGISSPNEQLEVAGNIRIPASSATAGIIFKGANRFIHNYGTAATFVGQDAGNLSLTGINNTGIGYQSLTNITTGQNNSATGYQSLYNNTSGNYNTATGSQALYNNTSGNNNTANGYNSLRNNTTGLNNTAIGYSSLQNMTTGGTNVAIGSQALFNSTTASGNIGIGVNTLFNNTTGGSNTAVGMSVLYNNTTGTGNSAYGYNALYNNTTGQLNQAFGYLALNFNTTGIGNCAMGYVSLYNNSTGMLNVGNGYFSLFNNTTGTGNVGIGYNTLNTLTTGGNNTAIGYQANVAANNLTNTTAIGNGATATASNEIRLGNAAITSLYCAGAFAATTANTPNLFVAANGQIMRSTAAAGGAYDAGIGITLIANTFSHTAHTGDATGTTSLKVVALQGVGVSAAAPANTQVLRYNGTNWIPSNESAYAAGIGLSLTANTFTNTGDLSSVNELQNLSFTANTSTLNISLGTGVALPLFVTTSTVAGLVPGSNNGGATTFLNGNGAWTVPAGTTYAAGAGITLAGTTFSHSNHTGDATGNTLLTVTGLRGRNVLANAPATGQVLGWDGFDWGPSNSGVYGAGTGILLGASSFSHAPHTGDATGATALTVVALQGRNIASITPTDRNVLTWVNASSRWEPALFTSLADANNDTKITVEASPNEDKIKFSTNGTQRMVIDNTGKVGIGVTGPTSFLEVAGSIGTRVVATGNASITLDATHSVILADNTVGIVINLPDATTCAGRIYLIKNIGGNIVSVKPFAGQTLEGSLFPTSVNNTGDAIVIVCYGTGWYIFAAKP
jgi:hypothetical protein